MQKRMKLNHFLTPIHTNSNEFQDLNVTPETIKILQKGANSNFSDIDHTNIFLDVSPKAKETKAKISYWDYIQMKTFHTAEEE